MPLWEDELVGRLRLPKPHDEVNRLRSKLSIIGLKGHRDLGSSLMPSLKRGHGLVQEQK